MTHRLAQELLSRGHAVQVVTQRSPRTLPAREMIDGVPVRRLIFLSGRIPPLREASPAAILVAVAGMVLAPLAALQLYIVTRQFGPDVVNIHYVSTPATYMAVVARFLRLPLVVSFHGSDVPDTPFSTASVRRVLQVCGRARAITTCSDDLRTQLSRFLPSSISGRVRVAYAGIDPLPEQHDRAEPHGSVVTLARLVEKKGIESLIHALALLRERGVQAHVVLGGDGPLRSQLEALSIQSRVDDTLTFLGDVHPTVARSLLRDAAFVVAPSLWEAFGMVSLEAMSAGRAVIATRSGGTPEVVSDGETGILVTPGDPVQLADAMQTLLADPTCAAALGACGRERAAAWTWERATSGYLDAYAVALGHGHPEPVPTQPTVGCA